MRRSWWVPIIAVLVAQMIVFAAFFTLINNERDARIEGNTASLVNACHKRNKITSAVKALVDTSTGSASGFPADIVGRIQDPAVRELLAAISNTSAENREKLRSRGDAIKQEDCSAIERRAEGNS